MSLPASAASARPAPASIDWRWALPRIGLVFLVTRLLLLATAVAVEVTTSAPPGLVRADERPVLASLTLWDGEHYLSIATDGYQAEVGVFPEYAFYPGYPVSVRATALLSGGDLALAAVIAANVAFALALVALYALSLRYLTPERAVLGLWFLALAPPSIAFGLSYAESLFLLLVVCAFLAAETRHPWLAGIALAFAAVTRAPGILMALPLLVLYARRDGLADWRQWLPLLLAPAALAVFFGYLWSLTGDPLAPVHAQRFWDPPEVGGAAPAGRIETVAPTLILAYWVGGLVVYLFLFVYMRHDRLPVAYWLVAAMAVLSVFLSGTLESAPRYLAVGWPFAWVLANRRSHAGRAVVLLAFAVGSVIVAWLAFSWRLAP